MESDLLLTWERFIYELSALGFVFDKRDHCWKREDGAVVSDVSLREIHTNWPIFLTAALKLWGEGTKKIAVESSWEKSAFVARIKAVE